MIHDSTWLGRTRVMRRMQLTAALGLLLACVLLAGLAPTASASTYDIRGEWSLELSAPKQPTLSGKAIIDKMEPGGEFSGSGLFGGFIKATLSGTVSGSEASVTIVAEAPGGNITFIAPKAAIDTVKNSFAGSGAYYKEGKQIETGEVKATRLKTHKQIEEQEAQEKLEREEREARANVRGEWSLTLETGPKTLKGTALIVESANAKNEFASTSTRFEEGHLGGTFTGTLRGGEASVHITTEEVPGFVPPGSFTSETIVVSSKSNPTSMSGTGTFTVGEAKVTGTLTATKIRSYRQIEEQEAKEREAKEKQEKEALEAKEKLEREAREKTEREAKEKREREAREAVEKATKPLPLPTPVPAALMPVLLTTNTLTVGHGGALSLDLTSPNGAPVHGHLKLTLAKTGKRASAKHTNNTAGKSTTLGEASFSISGHATEIVKLKLSRAGRSELGHLKTLHVLVTITTQASGQPDATKAYRLTLHASGSARHKG